MFVIEEGSDLVLVGMTNTVIMAVGQGADRATSIRDRNRGVSGANQKPSLG